MRMECHSGINIGFSLESDFSHPFPFTHFEHALSFIVFLDYYRINRSRIDDRCARIRRHRGHVPYHRYHFHARRRHSAWRCGQTATTKVDEKNGDRQTDKIFHRKLPGCSSKLFCVSARRRSNNRSRSCPDNGHIPRTLDSTSPLAASQCSSASSGSVASSLIRCTLIASISRTELRKSGSAICCARKASMMSCG
jgi:hypothetical protein